MLHRVRYTRKTSGEMLERFMLNTVSGVCDPDTAEQFDEWVGRIIDETPEQILVGGNIIPGGNWDILRDALAVTADVCQWGSEFEDIVPVLCCALKKRGCVIWELTLNPLSTLQCEMLARAVSKNKSLQKINICGDERDGIAGAEKTINEIRKFAPDAARMQQIRMRVIGYMIR